MEQELRPLQKFCEWARNYLQSNGDDGRKSKDEEKVNDLLFISTMAKLAPLITMPWPMTSPSPRAPPVTTPTLPSKEKEARVRFM